MNEEEIAEQIARFRAGMDQARAASQEISQAVAEFYTSLRMRGLPDSACEALAVEYLAQMFGGSAVEDED